MTEKFLHYLWKMKLYNHENLRTTSGEKIRVITAGEHNHNAGPDFLNAKIKIGETLWAGTVELHLKSSDWLQHAHNRNAAYHNVVLHVVYENDKKIMRDDGAEISCLELKGRFDSGIFDAYSRLMNNTDWIPCKPQLVKISSITMEQWLHRMMIERLEEKTLQITASLQANQSNWENTFYEFLAQSFGAKINAEPFRMLARSLPVKVLAKHKNSLLQLEALLFGTAGFLNESYADEYPAGLKKEFDFLRKKYDLQPLRKHQWKFLRLRPANFPTIRIAQFAQLVFKSSHLFSKILETKNAVDIIKLFEVVPSPYWETHYQFDKLSTTKQKTLGDDAIDLIIINMVAPFLFVYGKLRDEDAYMQQALNLLEKIKAEKNSIITEWKASGVKVKSAYESQALLQLRNVYCKNFRCLDCSIGHKLLSGKKAVMQHEGGGLPI